MIGNHYEMLIAARLDRIETDQRETLRSLDRIELKIGEPTPQRAVKPRPQWLTLQFIIYAIIAALALGGHITFDQAKAILTGLPR